MLQHWNDTAFWTAAPAVGAAPAFRLMDGRLAVLHGGLGTYIK